MDSPTVGSCGVPRALCKSQGGRFLMSEVPLYYQHGAPPPRLCLFESGVHQLGRHLFHQGDQSAVTRKVIASMMRKAIAHITRTMIANITRTVIAIITRKVIAYMTTKVIANMSNTGREKPVLLPTRPPWRLVPCPAGTRPQLVRSSPVMSTRSRHTSRYTIHGLL